MDKSRDILVVNPAWQAGSVEGEALIYKKRVFGRRRILNSGLTRSCADVVD